MGIAKNLSQKRIAKMTAQLPDYERHLASGDSLNIAARKVGWGIDARLEFQRVNSEAARLSKQYRQVKTKGMGV